MSVKFMVAAIGGSVQMIVEPEGKPTLDVIFPAAEISAICALLLGAARSAAESIGQDEPISAGTAVAFQGRIEPTSLSLCIPEGSTRPALVAQMGQTMLAIDVADPAGVGLALQTMAAPRSARPS